MFASDPLTVTDTSTVTDTPCPSEVEHILLTLSVFPNTASKDIQQHVNSANNGNVDNDTQSDCHSDSDSCAPVVPDHADAMEFRSIMIWEWCSFANMFSQSL